MTIKHPRYPDQEPPEDGEESEPYWSDEAADDYYGKSTPNPHRERSDPDSY